MHANHGHSIVEYLLQQLKGATSDVSFHYLRIAINELDEMGLSLLNISFRKVFILFLLNL